MPQISRTEDQQECHVVFLSLSSVRLCGRKKTENSLLLEVPFVKDRKPFGWKAPGLKVKFGFCKTVNVGVRPFVLRATKSLGYGKQF